MVFEVPNAEKEACLVSFHGATLHLAALRGEPHVAVHSLITGMGLDTRAQKRKLMRHSGAWEATRLACLVKGRKTTMLCLPLAKLDEYLGSIALPRVRADKRDAVAMYRRDCHAVLRSHWQRHVQAARGAGNAEAVRRVYTEAWEVSCDALTILRESGKRARQAFCGVRRGNVATGLDSVLGRQEAAIRTMAEQAYQTHMGILEQLDIMRQMVFYITGAE